MTLSEVANETGTGVDLDFNFLNTKGEVSCDEKDAF